MILDRDAFKIDYDPERTDVKSMKDNIRKLGYKPWRVEEEGAAAPERTQKKLPLPAPIAQAVAAAANNGKFVCVEFYASWCAPCKVLEKNVLHVPFVLNALKEFEFIKVDTDKFPQAAKYFGVVGLPTLVVLDRTGSERYRHLGPIAVDAFVKALNKSRRTGTGSR